MEEYKVIIFPTAQNDLWDIENHLSNHDPEEAMRYFELFMEKTQTILKTPEIYSPAKDTQLRLRGYRMLFIENHIVFYVIRGNNVEFRRVLYARRQYEWLV